MASQWIDVRDMKFILYEVFKMDEQLLGQGPFADYDRDTVDMVLDSAAKLAELDEMARQMEHTIARYKL